MTRYALPRGGIDFSPVTNTLRMMPTGFPAAADLRRAFTGPSNRTITFRWKPQRRRVNVSIDRIKRTRLRRNLLRRGNKPGKRPARPSERASVSGTGVLSGSNFPYRKEQTVLDRIASAGGVLRADHRNRLSQRENPSESAARIITTRDYEARLLSGLSRMRLTGRVGEGRRQGKHLSCFALVVVACTRALNSL